MLVVFSHGTSNMRIEGTYVKQAVDFIYVTLNPKDFITNAVRCRLCLS
jgi:hypothetical protein